jgi:RimJ/RimL family protein N-acetyltransferase
MLTGERILLQPFIDQEGFEEYLRWINAAESTRFLETGRFPTDRKQLQLYVEDAQRHKDTLLLKITIKQTRHYIGNIKLGPIDWIHRRGSLGVLIGEPAARGQGYGREAVALLVQHAFAELGLHKITAGAYADHTASLQLFRSLGFQEEGRLRQQLYREGAFHDCIYMGLLKADWKHGVS